MSFLGAGVLYGLPFLRVAPNRLVSGEPISLIAVLQVLQGPGWLLAVLMASLLLAAFFKPGRALLWSVVLVSCVLVSGLIWLAGRYASFVAEAESPLARTSLGGAFWAVLLLLGLIAADGVQRLRAGSAQRFVVAAAVLSPVGFMLSAGWCDDLSIMKEYANRSDIFVGVVVRHIQIVMMAVAFTLCIGLPLGWLAGQKNRIAGALFPLLNIIQTIPSIALFGLLMAPLALLAAAWPALARAGISGVGLAPAVIALTLYGLLPVVRATVAGLEAVPSGVIDAATGMGMTRFQIFGRIEFPLALPVVLGGVRTAIIQAVGLAAVTALIGAGGLGAIMFEGLFSSAQDLVLLGVVPIIALGVLADVAFKVLISLTSVTGSGSGMQS
ncbi:ABC transporter permease [Polaromonas sp. JS666]|uniref:ABC transporter permease n=1 Tax=Polaromonas sp. (strain JS666 / ATCC BAA-500) TaxID=296591 RepID=UPI0000463D82|nr:ABC transporter permease [Polaromonas sp. JS666]ABE45530.1 binding-protein-dependent transport systems inner membrane component [Polaromonas sp. JS666]